MSRLALALIFLVAACSPDEVADSTTTTEPGSTTPSVSTTVPGVSTTAPAATTTVPETTTSEATTTTATVPGNWASQPLVVSDFGALGWWDGASWVQVDELTSLPVNGGEDYQVAVLDLTATTTGGPEAVMCEPLNNVGVELAHPELLGEWPGPYGVAISAPWALTPQLVQAVPDDGTYSGFASMLLSGRGLDVDDPVVVQLLRVDLEGDGVNEVIVVAEEMGLPPQVGDYTVVFMRKVVEDEVATSVLGEWIIVDDEFGFQNFVSLRVSAVADLNGDGQMEIVVSSAFFEGLGVEVWEYVNDDIGMIPVIQTGCGV
jgi:hypothetical protein